MYSLIRRLFWKCYNNHVLRYIFFGGLATLVNLGTYYLLRALFHVPVTPANVTAVVCAILFAYFTNSRFVFASKARGFGQRFPEFVRFVGARISTMVIEVGGVWLMADVLHINDYFAKFVIQFVVLALNYVFSKWLVFTKKG